MAQKRKVTGIYSTDLQTQMDVIMAWTKSILTVIVYAVGFIALNVADTITGGATMTKALVSAAGPTFGWVLAFSFAAAFGFVQLVMWNRIFDLINNSTGFSWRALLTLVLALLVGIGDTILDTASVPIWLSASPLAEQLVGVNVWGTPVFDLIYYSMITVVAIVTMFGEMFVIMYFDMTDESITEQAPKPPAKDAMALPKNVSPTRRSKASKSGGGRQQSYASIHPALADIDFDK